VEGFEHPVKCPKCGFVSFPGLLECKKCGHKLAPAKAKASPPGVVSLFPGSPVPPGGPDASAVDVAAEPPPETPLEPSAAPGEPPAAELPPLLAESTPAPSKPQPPEAARPWREELSERVQDFRRRRARLRGDFDPSQSLEFDFEGGQRLETETEFAAAEVEFPQGETDLVTETPPSTEPDIPILDSLPLEKPGEETPSPGSAAAEAGELPLEHPVTEAERVKIVLESPEVSAEAADTEAAPLALPLAPMGRRFLAGVLDALVLLMAAGLFALIFWRAGGRLTVQPLNVAVVVFIGAFFIMAYFGLFTALTSTTPGLLWMGLEVRNLDGAFPTAREAFWRAFGYLISTAGLMLGFLWAVVDSEGFTWHDRMSGTFLTVADSAVESQRFKMES